jgi:hypothetical protein
MANLFGNLSQHTHGEFEYSLAIHAQEGITGDLTTTIWPGYVQDAILATIGMHCSARIPWLV